jgi:hypothetical protein
MRFAPEYVKSVLSCEDLFFYVDQLVVEAWLRRTRDLLAAAETRLRERSVLL